MDRTSIDHQKPSHLRARWRALCEELATVPDPQRGVMLRELDEIERQLKKILLTKRHMAD
ncbi:hypothetical protein [Mucisphaera calidilacus]|uniref:Uncharacterized protein n=1 Tax=Mucisphaera calidilacus TaxID=2527982 RepID=A0A518BZT4_9BACT|nr:hypothetical protein [Mucisphaera calidilacus]QDU72480.1 hypothetical protein Pan265_23460 [Mucisphaera calidilacus]